MRLYIFVLCALLLGNYAYSQSPIEGRVVDSLGNGIADVTIVDEATKVRTSSDDDGIFRLRPTSPKGTLTIRHVGYQTAYYDYNDQTSTIKAVLYPSMSQIDEVLVSTGYQTLPRERATGSFSTINKELFNQQVGPDILSRLPAIANSMVMDAGQSEFGGQMMIRGLSTISGPKDPLIVIDNFPYDGDINNINPNIVENITILKDAAASSIWGARAANGVIVITTKTGQFNKPITFELNSNMTVGLKPDLSYIPQMSAADFIDVETELYNRGFYQSRINSISRPLLTPVVDMLDQADKGVLSPQYVQQTVDQLRGVDTRAQLDRYMYEPSVNHQHFVRAAGGSSNFSWSSSLGYDHTKQTLGDTYQRINARFENRYQISTKLSLATNLYYTQTQTQSGRYGYSDIPNLLPYTLLADDAGEALAVPRNQRQSFVEGFGDGKLLDWSYYPLTDWQHQPRTGTMSDMLATVSLQYEFLKGLTGSVDYQYERQNTANANLATQESYAARDYINRFAQVSGDNVQFIVPVGSMLDQSHSLLNANNLRSKLSFNRNYGSHSVNAIGGIEMRHARISSNGIRYYGYNPQNMTIANIDYTRAYPNSISGGGAFIQNNQSLGEVDTRFISQFANASYSYKDTYTLSGSVRRDASNLFGLKTNDQWNPFWSAGFAWKLSNAAFYNVDAVPYLNIRSTYGFSGNVDPAMVAVNTIRFLSASVFTGLPSARFDNYYNPELRWETSKMLNVAADFKLRNNRLSGTIEYYTKNGENLFGRAPLDYTTGVSTAMLRNVANMRGAGWDFEIKSQNIDKAFTWSTITNFSIYRDKIEDYHLERALAQQYVNTYSPPISGIEGKPVYALFAYEWAGLDPQTGEAQGILDGEISKDYTAITGAGTPVDDLVYFGSAIPTHFGSVINALSYRNVSVQVGLNFKFGYWFRRRSINYTELLNGWRGHEDYALRWQAPGDENFTDIPVGQFTANSNRDRFYEGSSILVERGDHVRLQYINIGYTLSNLRRFKTMQLYFNMQNLGLLWRANDAGIDPDFNLGLSTVVTPLNFSFGLRASL